jgi:glycosyltransferase involved in cell wall biosynthesis
MDSFSVIVTTHNNAATLLRALQSVEEAIAFLRASGGPAAEATAEVLIVDDGSRDGTPELVREIIRSKALYRVLRRQQASSPSCARNVGAAAARGDLLFFLDGDDLFLPPHLAICCRALDDPKMCFVKTGVRLADPVHPDWRPRIEHSIVINLCLRRRCHLAIGGFLDYHLFTRQGNEVHPVCDIYYKLEDQYYNELLASLYPGVRLVAETVEHKRYPGNSFDRQYAKFTRPFGAYREELPPQDRFRMQLCEVIFQEELRKLRAKLTTASSRPPSFPGSAQAVAEVPPIAGRT